MHIANHKPQVFMFGPSHSSSNWFLVTILYTQYSKSKYSLLYRKFILPGEALAHGLLFYYIQATILQRATIHYGLLFTTGYYSLWVTILLRATIHYGLLFTMGYYSLWATILASQVC